MNKFIGILNLRLTKWEGRRRGGGGGGGGRRRDSVLKGERFSVEGGEIQC